jgi:regulator of sirC expression with transglutaminase-like and TPR domain
MNDLLIAELHSEQKGLLSKLVLLEEFIFNSEYADLMAINNITASCQLAIVTTESALERAEQLINTLFVDELLLDNHRDFYSPEAYKIERSLEYRFIAPSLKAVMIRHIIEACDFDCDLTLLAGKIMVRITCDDVYAIIFDPVTGESLNLSEFDVLMDDVEDPEQLQPDTLSHQKLIALYLTGLKNEFMKDGRFNDALKCVDLLLAFQPNDPFERRDRGFLLHQLDCFKVAVDDYKYFVQQCPKDPAAQLLKMQLEHITLSETILH